MRHVEAPDPVIRELRYMNRQLRTMQVVGALAIAVLAGGFGASLYLRSTDLEEANRRGNEEQVTTCFRSANQRADVRISLGRLLFKSDVPPEFVDSIRTLLLILPTVEDCQQLADDLGVNPRES